MKNLAILVVASLMVFGSCTQKADNANADTAKSGQETTEQTPPPPQPQTQAIDPQEQARIDAELITKFVADNKLTAKSTESGIFYVVEKEGKGANPTIDNTVKVHYKGTLLNGTTFDSSYDRGEPIEFPLRAVIRGWQEGIPLLKPGGKGKLIIPSGLAYGPQQVGPTISPNSVLVFDVELLEVK
ncbi:MAG TPA: FKBP-type peptidyl-prolyl cis-trans isomerase [Chitinophagales bacterium]|nr:FKBP-type peptidyl-prolyl cis-trans isomerase [Chitinophagales bacterium]HRK27610.1 FKBP-type peptidyl-prolyl cis-trans isomerase [Chitinophagales bacterium]